jgi:hypothetical protein
MDGKAKSGREIACGWFTALHTIKSVISESPLTVKGI